VTGELGAAGLFTVLLGAALAPIDLFIVNVALPTIDTELHTSASTLEWIIAGYGIAFALLLVIGGRLGDAFGRRRLFMTGLAAFTLTSLACGLAPTATVLVVARAAQGAAAAMMVPQALSIIQATTSGERRGRIFGYYGATAGVAMVIGQLLGGVLVSASGWRAVFLVNVPIGLAGVLLARRTVPETRAANPLGVDRWGTALLGLALLSLLVPVMEGRALDWPVWCWVLLAGCPFAAAAFLAAERRMEAAGGVPLLPMSILRVPSMRRGLGIALPFFVTFGGFLFVYALTLQDGLRLGPFESGLALSPLAVAFLFMSLCSPRIVSRIGHRAVVLGAGLQLTGLLTLLATVSIAWPDLTVLHFVPGTLLCGVGQGLTAPTMFRVILSRVPPELAGAGSGLLTTTQQASLALGVAIFGTLFATFQDMRSALIICTALQALLVAGIALAANRLPDPRG